MEELHSRLASPPQAARCADVNAAAGSGAKETTQSDPKNSGESNSRAFQ
jgi:hypothetical protein